MERVIGEGSSRMIKWAISAGVVLIAVVALVLLKHWESLFLAGLGTGLGIYIGRSTKK